MIVQAEPLPTVEILSSEISSVEFDIQHDKWAESGWLAVGRICRWAAENKMPHPPCPAAPKGPD